MTDASRPWELPSSFDEYQVLRMLGNGSMGQVYLARDTLLDRLVAVKLIASGAPDAAQRERFRTEARAIARVQHPNVVEIYRAGEVQGRPYLISELVRGKSLDQLSLPLPWEQVLGLAVDLARGLAAAHRRGVLHRDIKPANAMLTEEGAVKLLDFGVAKLVDAAGGVAGPGAVSSYVRRGPGPESPGAATVDAARPASVPPPHQAQAAPELAQLTGLIGTPRYMAPEVWRQEPATPRSDLYSLGALLYELCTGAAPHAAASLDALQRSVLEQDAAPLAGKAPEVSPAFAALVDRCLAREQGRRFVSAEAFREALEALRGGREAAGLRERPYPGLHSFGAEDRDTFFGRDAQVRAVLDRLRGEPLVVVAGDSGAGKSSLCRAGVLPRVAQGALGQGGAWAGCELLPGRNPLQALAAALAPLLDGGEGELLEVLRQSPLEVGRWVLARARPWGVVVLVDQMEELLTLAAPDELEPFTSALRSLAGSGPRLRVLATVRGDFLARLAALPGLAEYLSSGLYLLPHLGEAGLREAITAPARTQGYSFETEVLADSLVAAGHVEGGLPLLQFALSELWERRDRARRVVPAAALVALGGVEGALARHADGVLAEMRPGSRVAARRLLLRLVHAEDTRARRTRAELLGEPGSEDGEARAALEALVRGRLVFGRESPDGAATYELAHEALLRGWDTLRGWLANDQEQRALRQRLERACAEWERLGRPREQLWSRRQLAEAAGLDEEALGSQERAFLRTSRRAAGRRRLLVAAAALAVPLTAGAVYGGLQLRAWQEREREVARVLQSAEAAMTRGRELNPRVDALRSQAFAVFDEESSSDSPRAEADWAVALEAAAEQSAAHEEAIQSLESALAQYGARPDLRNGLAGTLFEYILISERNRHGLVSAQLLQRLERLPETNDLRQRLLEPARVAIVTEPAGARVEIEQANVQGRRWRWTPFRQLAKQTPIDEELLPPGSYRLRLRAAGRPEVVYPVLVERGESLRLHVPLPAAVPRGYAYVPPSRFLYGSSEDEDVRRTCVRTKPIHPRETGGFIIARHEVTFGEWIEFLRALPTEKERNERTPEATNYFGTIKLERSAGRYSFVLERKAQEPYRVPEGAVLHYRERTQRAAQDWSRMPVSGVSWRDAEAYTAWLSATGRLPGARLCTELEWEHAARGADGREYPHGNQLDPDDANFDVTYGRRPAAFGPDEVGSHPASDSPFGVADMSGNVWEWVASGGGARSVAFAGGSFYQSDLTARITNHGIGEEQTRVPWTGLRVCAAAPAP
ncbi:MAG TPA: SUMF1/EgtB/PvdO family nonheme iron enzyme [Myxococcaceae bacterium]|jgi:serine/threonine protein kinase/formylglycine-generating enzyme required for sulfatase activity